MWPQGQPLPKKKFWVRICPKCRYLPTNLRCVTSQKSEYLIYTAAEAWNQANLTYTEQDL
jgi:hypothetical protein